MATQVLRLRAEVTSVENRREHDKITLEAWNHEQRRPGSKLEVIVSNSHAKGYFELGKSFDVEFVEVVSP